MKASKKVSCEICGKECYSRGIKSHLRLAHHLVIKVITKVSALPMTKVNLKDDLSRKSKPVLKLNEEKQVIMKTKVLEPSDISCRDNKIVIDGYREALIYYTRNPEKAKKKWTELNLKLDQPLGWIQTTGNTWKALQRIFDYPGYINENS